MAWKRIDKDLFFFIYCNDVLIPKRALVVLSVLRVSASIFVLFLLCVEAFFVASVWKRADSTHHLKGHDGDDDSKTFFLSYPRKKKKNFIPDRVRLLWFFFFHFMFLSIFIIGRRKIINNKQKRKKKGKNRQKKFWAVAPCVRFLGAKKEKERKCVSLSSSFLNSLGTYSSDWYTNSWRRLCLITILILILFWMEMVRARCRVPPYRDRPFLL